jgi:hypothetical protein
MIQSATKLTCGAAILLLSFLLAVPLRAQDAGNVPSGVAVNPCGAVFPGAKISLKNEILVRLEMTWQRQN